MSTRRRGVRVCPSSLAAVPIRGELLARMGRMRLAIDRAEGAIDLPTADAARLELMVLGGLLGALTHALETHRDLHPFETETLAEIAALADGLGGDPLPESEDPLPESEDPTTDPEG